MPVPVHLVDRRYFSGMSALFSTALVRLKMIKLTAFLCRFPRLGLDLFLRNDNEIEKILIFRLCSHYIDTLIYLRSSLIEKTRPRTPRLMYIYIPHLLGKTDLIEAFNGTKESIGCYRFSIRLIYCRLIGTLHWRPCRMCTY